MTRFFTLAALAGLFSCFSLSAQNFQLDWADQIGGESSQNITEMLVTANGDIVLAGTLGGATDFDPGSGTAVFSSAGANDVFMAKYDAGGNYLWAKVFGGTQSDAVFDMVSDANGNLYLTGQFLGTPDMDPGPGTAQLLNAGLFDAYLSKYDSDGNFLWAKGLGGGFNEAGNSLAVDASNNIYLTGYFSDTLDLNPGPIANEVVSKGMSDVFVACYSELGGYVWGIAFGGADEDAGSEIRVGSGGLVHVGGQFSETIDIDPGAPVVDMTSAGIKDVFYLRLDSGGTFIKAFSIGGVADDAVFDLSLGAGNAFYLAGTFADTVDFDPGGGQAWLQSTGGGNAFLAAYDEQGAYRWVRNNGRGVTRRVELDAQGTLNTIGDFLGAINLGPGGDHMALGMNDILVARFDDNGAYQSSVAFGGTGIDVGRCVTGVTGGKLLYAAEFRSTIDADPGTGATTFIANGVDGILSALRLCEPSNTYVDAVIFEGETYLFPDGSTGTTCIVQSSVFMTSLGCDSTITTNLSILPSDSTFLESSTCDSAFSGIIVNVFSNINGCDSFVIVDVAWEPIVAGLINMGSTFIATPSGAQYQWIDVTEGGIPVPGANEQEFTTVIDGCYAVIVSIFTCSDTSECEYILTPGTGEPEWAAQLNIAPNPWSDGNLTLSWPVEVQMTTVELADAQGRILERRTSNGNNLIFENEGLPAGLYFLRFSSEDGAMVWRKVVKK